MKLTWSPWAIADRESIFDFILDDNPAAAIELDELFEQKSTVLIEHPDAGRAGRVEGTREFVVHRHYVFVYDVDADRVRILRVLHTSLQWPPSKKRRPARAKKK